MQVVLRSDLANLGKRGDIVTVADGYARNFLLPKGHAILATPGIRAQAEAMRASRDKKDVKARERATEIAKVLSGAFVVISGNASHDDKLYGSVGVGEIVAAIGSLHGIELEKRNVKLAEHIRELGDHEVEIALHPEVSVNVIVKVTE